MPTSTLAVEAALRRGGVTAALAQLETADAAAAKPGSGLRKWLVHSANLDPSIVDKTLETLKAEDVFEVSDLQVLRGLPLWSSIFSAVTKAKISAALDKELPASHAAKEEEEDAAPDWLHEAGALLANLDGPARIGDGCLATGEPADTHALDVVDAKGGVEALAVADSAGLMSAIEDMAEARRQLAATILSEPPDAATTRLPVAATTATRSPPRAQSPSNGPGRSSSFRRRGQRGRGGGGGGGGGGAEGGGGSAPNRSSWQDRPVEFSQAALAAQARAAAREALAASDAKLAQVAATRTATQTPSMTVTLGGEAGEAGAAASTAGGGHGVTAGGGGGHGRSQSFSRRRHRRSASFQAARARRPEHAAGPADSGQGEGARGGGAGFGGAGGGELAPPVAALMQSAGVKPSVGCSSSTGPSGAMVANRFALLEVSSPPAKVAAEEEASARRADEAPAQPGHGNGHGRSQSFSRRRNRRSASFGRQRDRRRDEQRGEEAASYS